MIHRVRFAVERRTGVHARRERFLNVAPSAWLRVSPAAASRRRRPTRRTAATRRRGFSRASTIPRPVARSSPDGTRAAGRWPRGSTQIKAGLFTYFEHTTRLVGCPPDWHRNPFTGVAAPRDVHWSRIDERALGDIKVIWEPSRFAWVYPLVRHYWREGDEDAAELFWQLLEDWHRANPPGVGVNWRCAQEIGIRAMACAFALHAFRDARATTPERILLAGRLMWTFGHRIALDLDDALSQQNNHGITAAAGLFTIGVLFPEFPESAGWADEGRRTLERLGRDLIYDDGSFVQHSLNYQRLMLHDYVWAIALAERAGLPLSDILRDRVRRSAELLWRLQDETTGSVPQYGHCDGALILPLDNCDALDFRPVTQAAAVLLDGVRWWPDGSMGRGSVVALRPRARLDAARASPGAGRRVGARRRLLHAARRRDVGDDPVRRVPPSARAARHAARRSLVARPQRRDRRGHLQLQRRRGGRSRRWRGPPRTTPSPWTAPTRWIATAGFSGFRGSRAACCGRAEAAGETEYWEGEHDGYRRRGVRHRRGIVRIAPSAWLIIDRLDAAEPHRYRLHWLLPDGPHAWDEARLAVELQLREGDYVIQVATAGAAASGELVRAAADGSGWRSRYYYSREPALSFAVHARAATNSVRHAARARARLRAHRCGTDHPGHGRRPNLQRHR